MSKGEGKLNELKSLIQTTHQVDDVFHQRDLDKLFGGASQDEAVFVAPQPKSQVQVIMQQSKEDTFWSPTESFHPSVNSQVNFPPLKPDFNLNSPQKPHTYRDNADNETASPKNATSLYMTYERLHGLKMIDEKVSKQTTTQKLLSKLDGGTHHIVVKADQLKDQTQGYQQYVAVWKDKLAKNKKQLKVAQAPKNFYRNFRETKIADAKYMQEHSSQWQDPEAIKVCGHTKSCDCHTHVNYALEENTKQFILD